MRKGTGDPLLTARNALRGAIAKSPVEAFSRARRECPSSAYRALIRWIASIQPYARALLPSPFPPTPSAYRKLQELAPIGFDDELAWHVALVRWHSKALAHLVAERAAFQEALISDDPDTAEVHLLEVERISGGSLTALELRLAYQAQRHGDPAAQEVVDGLKDRDDVEPLLSFVIHYRYSRATRRLSPDRAQTVLQQQLANARVSPALSDYLQLYSLDPQSLSSEQAANCLRCAPHKRI
jgi:hypothetical protein